MATKPVTDVLYRSPEPGANFAHAAVEEVRNLANQRVIDAISAQINELKTKMGSQVTKVKASVDTRFFGIELRTRQNLGRDEGEVRRNQLPNRRSVARGGRADGSTIGRP